MLLKKGKRKNHKVHKLVYEAFVGKIPEGCDVHHLDNNKLNNHFSNLEIVEMSKHRSLHFTGENNPRATLTQQEVDEIRKRYKQETIKQIADSLGISYRNIHRIVRGNRWK